MRVLRANLRNTTEEQRKLFKQCDCLLTISVGQVTHEQDHLKATFTLLEEMFNSCIITLHDGLQRYTIALDKTEDAESFHKASIIEGDLWLERNKELLENFSILKNIIRWKDWLTHMDYLYYQDKILELMRTDEEYKNTFLSTRDAFLDRYVKRLDNVDRFDLARAKQLCMDYLIEECVVLCLWPETACHYELYTNKHNAAVEETRRRFVFSKNVNLLKPIVIGFNHRADLKPQQFSTVTTEAELTE